MACLQEFASVKSNLKNSRKCVVEALHHFIFEQKGDRGNRQRIRIFTGFDYDETDKNYTKKCEYISQHLTSGDIIAICTLLGLDHGVDDMILHIFKNLKKGNLLHDIASGNDDGEDGNDDSDDDDNSNQAGGRSEDKNENKDGNDDDNNDNESDGDSSQNDVHHYSYKYTENVKSKSRFTLSFRDVEETVKSFDGSSDGRVETWIDEFEDTAAMMKWDELQKLIFAKKSLKGRAKLFIAGEKHLNTWKKLRAALLEEFECKVNSAKIHKMLSEKKMEKDEDVFTYFYKMKEIAAQGNIEDGAFIQHVIDGIKDLHVNKAILFGAKKLKEFKEKLKTYEEYRTSQKPINDQRKPEKKNTEVYKKNDGRPETKCFNCGMKGHISANCHNKNRGPKCFNCNSFGHLSKECKSKKEDTQSSAIRCLSVEKDRMLKNIKILNQNKIALFDTGSMANVIKLKVYKSLMTTKLNKSFIVLTGFGSKNNTVRPIGCINLNVEIDDDIFELEFHVIPDECLNVDVVIGYPICLKAEVTINLQGVRIKKLEELKMMQIDVGVNDGPEINVDETASKEAKQTVKRLIANYRPEKTKTTNVSMKITLMDAKVT